MTQDDIRIQAVKDAEAVMRLYENQDFKRIILDRFIGESIRDLVLTQNVDTEATRAELKARKILKDFLYNIIDEAKKLSEEIQ
jgi:hypothetical protein